MPHSINSHVLTGANPSINNEIHALLKLGFVTLTISYQGLQINPPSIVLEIFDKTAGVCNRKIGFLATGGGMLSVILCPRDLHMSSQKQSLLKPDI